MRHGKQMILVPEDVLATLERKQKQETSPLVTNLMNTEENMNETLKRTDMFDDEKQKLYHGDLERYLNLKHQKKNDFTTININSTTPLDANKPAEKKEGTSSDSAIVEPIPRTMRDRAMAILNRLKSYPNVISWDKTGQVKLDGKNVQGSNISDLLSDVVRCRKNFNPVGPKEFFCVLSTVNMPKDLVRNEERWKQALQLMSEEEEPHTSVQRPLKTPSKYELSIARRKTKEQKLTRSKITSRWEPY